MPRTGTWLRGNPFMVTLPAPLDKTDPSTPVVIDSATTNGYVLDRAAQTELTAAAAASASTLTVESTSKFVTGQSIELYQDDTSRHISVITVTDATTLTLTTPTTFAAGVGQRVIRQLGSVIAGSAYGTASLTNTDWGYTVLFPEDHASADIDELQQLLVEIVLDKAATGAHWERGWDILRVDARARP